MGSFNVTCALSGLSISFGDPCYYLPLKPNKYADSSDYFNLIGSDILISNDGSTVFFSPYLLPVLGTYDDYGSIKPTMGPNIKAIERVFKTKAKKFFEKPTEFMLVDPPPIEALDIKDATLRSIVEFADLYVMHDPSYNNKEVNLTGCFIHAFAWDAAVKYMSEKADYGTSAWTHFPIIPPILEDVGFKKISTRTEGRYTDIYAIEGCDKYIIASDGEFSHIEKMTEDGRIPKEKSDYSNQIPAYRLHELNDTWKELTGQTLVSDKSLFTNKSCFNYAWDVFVKGTKTLELIKNNSYEEKQAPELTKAIMKKYKLYKNYGDIMRVLSYYTPEILEDNRKIRDLTSEMECVSYYMYLNGKLFAPTIGGPQDGDRDAERSLLEASIKYLDKKDEKAKKEEEEND